MWVAEKSTVGRELMALLRDRGRWQTALTVVSPPFLAGERRLLWSDDFYFCLEQQLSGFIELGKLQLQEYGFLRIRGCFCVCRQRLQHVSGRSSEGEPRRAICIY